MSAPEKALSDAIAEVKRYYHQRGRLAHLMGRPRISTAAPEWLAEWLAGWDEAEEQKIAHEGDGR